MKVEWGLYTLTKKIISYPNICVNNTMKILTNGQTPSAGRLTAFNISQIDIQYMSQIMSLFICREQTC